MYVISIWTCEFRGTFVSVSKLLILADSCSQCKIGISSLTTTFMDGMPRTAQCRIGTSTLRSSWAISSPHKLPQRTLDDCRRRVCGRRRRRVCGRISRRHVRGRRGGDEISAQCLLYSGPFSSPSVAVSCTDTMASVSKRAHPLNIHDSVSHLLQTSSDTIQGQPSVMVVA